MIPACQVLLGLIPNNFSFLFTASTEISPQPSLPAALQPFRSLSYYSVAGRRTGLAPDDYSRVEQLREANLVARKILRISARVGEENNG